MWAVFSTFLESQPSESPRMYFPSECGAKWGDASRASGGFSSGGPTPELTEPREVRARGRFQLGSAVAFAENGEGTRRRVPYSPILVGPSAKQIIRKLWFGYLSQQPRGRSTELWPGIAHHLLYQLAGGGISEQMKPQQRVPSDAVVFILRGFPHAFPCGRRVHRPRNLRRHWRGYGNLAMRTEHAPNCDCLAGARSA